MVSDTSRTRDKRKNRKKKMGQQRKKALEGKGTTPKFPIHASK